jgi:hypothetical protein
LDSKTLLEKDKWYHVVGIYDGQSMQLIIDGSLESFAMHTGKINPASVGITIGEMLPGDDRYYLRGLIDEVKIFNEALSISQASTLMSDRCIDCKVSPLAVWNQDNKSELRVFPNPVFDQLTILSKMPISQLTILDLTGKQIKAKVKPNVSNGFQIDLTGFPKGIYYMLVYRADQPQSIKIIKQ